MSTSAAYSYERLGELHHLAAADHLTTFADQIQMIMFLKNLSIMGGLLLVAAYGAGDWSLDAQRKK